MIKVEINYDAPSPRSKLNTPREEDIPPCPFPGHDVYVQGNDMIRASRHTFEIDGRGFPATEDLFWWDDIANMWKHVK